MDAEVVIVKQKDFFPDQKTITFGEISRKDFSFRIPFKYLGNSLNLKIGKMTNRFGIRELYPGKNDMPKCLLLNFDLNNPDDVQLYSAMRDFDELIVDHVYQNRKELRIDTHMAIECAPIINHNRNEPDKPYFRVLINPAGVYMIDVDGKVSKTNQIVCNPNDSVKSLISARSVDVYQSVIKVNWYVQQIQIYPAPPKAPPKNIFSENLLESSDEEDAKILGGNRDNPSNEEDELKEDELKEDESEEDKPNENESKEDKSNENESKEDKPKEDEYEEDKPKVYKLKEDKPKKDKLKEDEPQEKKSKKKTSRRGKVVDGTFSSDKTECAICVDSYQAGAKIATTSCGHTFHKECLSEWTSRKSECPMCKTKIC